MEKEEGQLLSLPPEVLNETFQRFSIRAKFRFSLTSTKAQRFFVEYLEHLDFSGDPEDDNENFEASESGKILIITDSLLTRVSNLKRFSATMCDTNTDSVSDQGLRNLTRLTHLKLQRNHNITTDGISSLESLKKLNICGTSSIDPDQALLRMTNLISLSMEGYIPPPILCNQLTKLETLYLKNAFHINDKSLSFLKRMKKLSLFGSHLYGHGFKEMKRLHSLKLVSCYISQMDDIGNLINLRKLQLEHLTPMHSFKFIVNLTNLKYLSIGRYVDIPNQLLCQLTQLKKLQIVDNETITNSGISTLTKLTFLGIYHKNDTITSDGMRGMKKLWWLIHPENQNFDSNGVLSKLESLIFINDEQIRM